MRIVEKPRPEVLRRTPRGRGGVHPDARRIFHHLEQATPERGSEIQLTDAIKRATRGGSPCFAYRFKGTRYDCGSKLGYLQATVA